MKVDFEKKAIQDSFGKNMVWVDFRVKAKVDISKVKNVLFLKLVEPLYFWAVNFYDLNILFVFKVVKVLKTLKNFSINFANV